jgi:single-stranded-DNA-specific exonuclease
VERRLDIPPAPIAHVRALERALGVSFATAQVLVRRGLGDESAARAWLEAADRHDPSAFAGIELAVGLVLEHVRAGTRITVHGDYDVDGVCSTAILVRALRALGAEVDWFLPSRGEDGYGLSAATVQRLGARGTRLLLTADCGITAVEEVALALASGVDVVVTDHHAPRADGTLPDAPIVHPVVCGYPCPDLCAAGVAHKFAAALLAAAGGERPASVGGPGSGAEPSGSAGDAYCADDDLDLVALATVADCVPLRGENRRLVREGLRALAVSPKPGIRALLRVAKVDPSALDARAVGFRLAPRINAAGRLYRADAGLELVLTEDPERAAAIADELDHANAERRHTETRIVFEAEAQVREAGDQPAYVLAADGWHPGVIGIVASRIAERHHRPCVLIALEGEQGTGSGRSIPTFDLLGGLHASSAHLTRHGGHRAAAGCAIARDQVDAFRAAFIAHADATLSAEDLVPTERVDAVVAGDELGLPLAEELERLAPFGIGNPAVSLLVPAARLVHPRPMGDEGRHLRFTVEAGGHRARAVAFGIGHLPDGDLHDATFALELNEWGGAVEPRLVLRHAQQPLPAPIELVGEPEDAVEAALAELAAALPPGAPSRAPGVPRDRRGGGAAGTLAALVASGEPVLVVCADAPRRRRHLEGRLGGFALVAWHALEREPSLLDAYAHVLALDPPVPDAHAALIDERFTLAWGQAETSYALLAHEAGYDLRPVAAAVYRALRATAPTLEDVVVAAPSPAAAGRALRVLDELGLIRVDGRTAALLEARRTDLDRSAAFRAYATRLAEGRARLGAATTVQAA